MKKTIILFVLISISAGLETNSIPTNLAEYDVWKREYIENVSSSTPLRREMMLHCKNGYVIADMQENNGIYDQGADMDGEGSYHQITFSWPPVSSSTSGTRFKVDSFTYAGTEASPAMPTPDAFDTYTDQSLFIGTTITV